MEQYRGWLEAMDLRSWRDNIAHGHVAFHVLDALHQTGALDRLKAAGEAGVELETLAKDCGLDAHLLGGALGYMTLSDEIFAREGDRYRLTPRGAEWLFSGMFLNMIFKIRAYASLHTELLPALRGQKRYGVDFVRDGQSVARFSEIGTKAMNPWVAKTLGELGAKVVVDIACGAAHTLINFCNLSPALRGIGVDIDEGSLREAKTKVAEAHMGDRIRLAWGDLTRPDSYAAHVADADAFHCMAALHEFLRDGREAMVAMLRHMAELFPGRHLLVLEFCHVSDKEYLEMPLHARIPLLYYQYIMHPLSLQGIPVTQAEWRSIFRDAGLREIKVEPVMAPFMGFVLQL